MKHHTWKIFYIIFVTAFVLLLSTLYLDFKNIHEKHWVQIQHYTQMIAKTVHADLLQQDILLTVLGQQLLTNNNYTNTRKTKKLFDDLLTKNNYIVAFGLSNVSGRLIATSSNIKNTSNINLRTNKITGYDFKRALESDMMVLGRTIFFKPLGEWVIPIRKAIRNNNGRTIGVMTAGIRNENNAHYLDSLKFSQDYSVMILKDYDDEKKMYRQYVSKKDSEELDAIYNAPVPTDHINKILQLVTDKYNTTVEELRTRGEALGFTTSTRLGEKEIVGITYDKDFKVWILVGENTSRVRDEFKDVFVIYTSIFILSFLVIFLLFKGLIAAEKRKEKELVYLAEHDILTGLPNRIYLYKHIDDWINLYGDKYYVVYIDLDNFKNINDKFGHTIGDEILVEVAKRLAKYFDKGEMLVRQGGDEFIVLKTCIGDINIEEYFNVLITSISEVYYIQNNEFRIGMSIGVARYPEDAGEIEKLLSFADTAMYEAKKRKNSFCLFSESMRHSSVVRTDIEHELRGAIENEELWMVYQPQINSGGILSGVEALVRWENKKLGFVPPDKFIGVAEDTGLIRKLGDFITRRALQEMKNVLQEAQNKFTLSINISVIQLIEGDFLENLLLIIEEEKFDKSLLILEITESLSIRDLDYVIPLLHAIREEEIEISLDDFGTGYSSLSVLRDLPINELKIDKSFVDKILYDDTEKALVHSIINIGKNFGMKTLAEGVESIEQVKILQEAKCDIFQGYYYSKPLSLVDLTQYIQKYKET